MKNKYIILAQYPNDGPVSVWGEDESNPGHAIVFDSHAAALKEIENTILLGGLKTQIVKLELGYLEI
jgi:hypothetical protein